MINDDDCDESTGRIELYHLALMTRAFGVHNDFRKDTLALPSCEWSSTLTYDYDVTEMSLYQFVCNQTFPVALLASQCQSRGLFKIG